MNRYPTRSTHQSSFFDALDRYQCDPGNRTWFYVPYDQLNMEFEHLQALRSDTLGLVFCESLHRGRERPYHKQKLGTLLVSQRHFALEQAAQGVAVRYLVGAGSYADQLRSAIQTLGPLRVLRLLVSECWVLRTLLHCVVSAVELNGNVA